RGAKPFKPCSTADFAWNRRASPWRRATLPPATIVAVPTSSTIGDETRRMIRVKPVLICGIVIWMAALSARATDDSVTEQQIRLTEIAAPEFDEARRGEALKALFAASGLDARTDQAGNVIAERSGSDAKGVVLFVAHLDTVFPAGTDVHVKHERGHLTAPGISDNGAGLAAVAGLARALFESRIRTEKTIVL